MIEISKDWVGNTFVAISSVDDLKTKSSGAEMYAIIKTTIMGCIQLPDFPKITFVNAKPKKERKNTKIKPIFVGIKRPIKRPCKKASIGSLKVVFSIAYIIL